MSLPQGTDLNDASISVEDDFSLKITDRADKAFDTSAVVYYPLLESSVVHWYIDGARVSSFRYDGDGDMSYIATVPSDTLRSIRDSSFYDNSIDMEFWTRPTEDSKWLTLEYLGTRSPGVDASYWFAVQYIGSSTQSTNGILLFVVCMRGEGISLLQFSMGQIMSTLPGFSTPTDRAIQERFNDNNNSRQVSSLAKNIDWRRLQRCRGRQDTYSTDGVLTNITKWWCINHRGICQLYNICKQHSIFTNNDTCKYNNFIKQYRLDDNTAYRNNTRRFIDNDVSYCISIELTKKRGLHPLFFICMPPPFLYFFDLSDFTMKSLISFSRVFGYDAISMLRFTYAPDS